MQSILASGQSYEVNLACSLLPFDFDIKNILEF